MQCRCLAHDCYFDDVRTAGAAAPPRDLRLCTASLRSRPGEGSLPAAATTPSQSENCIGTVGISRRRDESAGKSWIGLRRHNRHIARPNCLPAGRRKCRRIFGSTRYEASSVRNSVNAEANSCRRGVECPFSRLLCEKDGAPGAAERYIHCSLRLVHPDLFTPASAFPSAALSWPEAAEFLL